MAKVTPNAWTFNNTFVGASDDKAFTLQNNGTGTLTGIVLSATGSGFSINSTDCTASLAESATCTINVRFTPSSAGGSSGSLKVESANATNGTVNVPLDGTGSTAPSTVAITPNPFDFGAVEFGTAVKHTFTFTNSGGTQVHVVSIDKVAGSGTFTIPSSSDGCSGANVAPATPAHSG